MSVAIITGSVFSVMLFFLFLNGDSFAKLAASASVQTSQNLISDTSFEPFLIPAQANPGIPVRLKIPKLKVDAAIESVGITRDGAMGAPKLPRNAAWYNLGPRPGEIGTAAIAGHVNWYNGATAIFANLKKLKPGDKIIVQDDKGANVTFIVRKIHTYSSKENPSDVFISNDDKSHITLITCIGVWNKKTKEYSQRLVVFADRE